MSDVKEDHKHALLVEGARSYPQALAALSEFRRLVVEECRAALSGQLQNIASAMAVPLSPKDVVPWTRPDSLSASLIDGDSGGLGVKLPGPGFHWGLYTYLTWGAGSLRAVDSIWFKDASWAERTYAAFLRQKPAYPMNLDSKEVMLVRKISAEDMSQLSDILRNLNEEWKRLWKRVGSLKQFQPKNVGA
jgi:hypothetical protein